MDKRKLLSALLNTKDLKITITLFKTNDNYMIRVAYENDVELVKENNSDVNREFVYYLSQLIEKADLETIDTKDYGLGNLVVYFGEDEYLMRYFDRQVLEDNESLHQIIYALLSYVDDNEEIKEMIG